MLIYAASCNTQMSREEHTNVIYHLYTWVQVTFTVVTVIKFLACKNQSFYFYLSISCVKYCTSLHLKSRLLQSHTRKSC